MDKRTSLPLEVDFGRNLMGDRIFGECLCGEVEYSIENDFAFLLFCHCEQCRRIAGSAHASNLFSATSSLNWERGEDKVKKFHHQSRDFTKAFCSECGSGLPYKSHSGEMVIVPAGSLKSEPKYTNAAKVFLAERTDWTPSEIQVEEFQKFPTYFSD
jgi:hypothetical protein